MVLTRGPCRIAEWSMSGTTKEELISKRLTSDHRPVHATIALGAAAVKLDVEEDATDSLGS